LYIAGKLIVTSGASWSPDTLWQFYNSPSGASAAAVSVIVLQEVLPGPGEVVLAVHSGQPESLVGNACNWVMPDIARGSQPKAISPLTVHVTAIGCSWRPVHTEITLIGPNLAKEGRKGIGWRSQYCHHSSQARRLSKIYCLVPTVTVVTDVLLDKVRMGALGC